MMLDRVISHFVVFVDILTLRLAGAEKVPPVGQCGAGTEEYQRGERHHNLRSCLYFHRPITTTQTRDVNPRRQIAKISDL